MNEERIGKVERKLVNGSPDSSTTIETHSGVFSMPYEAVMHLKPHPLALLFPSLPEDEMEKLTHDIFSHGQTHAVVLYEGKILDGVHRTNACRKNSMDLKCVRFEDLGYKGTASQFVLSENNERRHLNRKILAVIEASILNYNELSKKQVESGKLGAGAGKLGGRGHRKPLERNAAQGVSRRKRAPQSRDQIAERTGLSRDIAQQAIDIAKRTPELVPQIVQGKVTFDAAAQKAKRRSPVRKPSATKPSVTTTSRSAKAFLQQQMESGFELLRNLREEIKRRRKEVFAPRPKGSWNLDAISKLDLMEILDWIEAELNKIPG